MIHGLSIAGDVFWIAALGIMASMSWGLQKRLPGDCAMPVAWRGEAVLVRAPKLAALWLLVGAAFLIGMWMKLESRTPQQTLEGAVIWLGVRATSAPLLAFLHMAQLRKGLETLEREGGL